MTSKRSPFRLDPSLLPPPLFDFTDKLLALGRAHAEAAERALARVIEVEGWTAEEARGRIYLRSSEIDTANRVEIIVGAMPELGEIDRNPMAAAVSFVTNLTEHTRGDIPDIIRYWVKEEYAARYEPPPDVSSPGLAAGEGDAPS